MSFIEKFLVITACIIMHYLRIIQNYQKCMSKSNCKENAVEFLFLMPANHPVVSYQ